MDSSNEEIAEMAELSSEVVTMLTGVKLFDVFLARIAQSQRDRNRRINQEEMKRIDNYAFDRWEMFLAVIETGDGWEDFIDEILGSQPPEFPEEEGMFD